MQMQYFVGMLMEMITFYNIDSQHKGHQPACYERGGNDVSGLEEMFISSWQYLFFVDDLVSILTGSISSAEITENLLTA